MKSFAAFAFSGLLALPLAAQTPAPASARAPKIAVIDVQRLLLESAAGKEAQARVKKLIDQKQAENERMQKELAGLQEKLQTQGPSMSDDARDKLNQEYQSKGIAYKRFQDDAQRQVNDAQQKELADLEKRVMPVITQVGKEQGYTLIFNKYAPGMLVYADDSVDITDEVLRRFNTQVSAPPAPAAAGKGHAAPSGASGAARKKPGAH